MIQLLPPLAWFSPTELIIILVIVLVLFGPSKLPGLGKGMGSFIANFKREIRDLDDDEDAEKGKKKLKKPDDEENS